VVVVETAQGYPDTGAGTRTRIFRGGKTLALDVLSTEVWHVVGW